jgi:D-glycero-D-manno-heptose 1,7-bisphosphate phosphatase
LQNLAQVRAIFLDRDGVINKTFFKDGKSRAPFQLDHFEFLPGVAEAVEIFHAAGFLTVVVTNQPDVKRGWVDKSLVETFNKLVADTLRVHDIWVCYHIDEDSCECRKPKPGLLLEAAEKWKIDLSRSFMIGDRYSDIEAGRAAGCKTVLIGAGEGDEIVLPDLKANSLLEASQIITKL